MLATKTNFQLISLQHQTVPASRASIPEVLMDAGVHEMVPPPLLTRRVNPHTLIPSRPRQEVITYTVRSGDTLFGISEKYGITPETILWSNAILKDDPHLLRPDQELLISPVTGVLNFSQNTSFLEISGAKIWPHLTNKKQCQVGPDFRT